MKETLDFIEVVNNKDLVSKPTYKYIMDNFTEEEINNFFVARINPEYMDGISLFNHYRINDKLGVNCLICECRRNADVKYVALLVPTGYKYNMSSVVRKHVNARVVSVANLDYVLESTGMEYGSINPLGLPDNWKVLIDPKVLNSEYIICGSGLKTSKISFPSKYLLRIKNSELLENLAKEG